MNKLLFAAMLVLASCQSYTPHVDLMYGNRNFEGSQDWEQTDEQNDVIGIQADCAGKNGFGPEIGLSFSRADVNDAFYVNRNADDTASDVQEIYVGLRKNFMLSESVQFMLSGGISSFLIDTEIDLTFADSTPVDTDRAYAPYVQAGTRFLLTDSLSAGIMYRQNFLDEDADIFVLRPDLNGGTLLFSLGWQF